MRKPLRCKLGNHSYKLTGGKYFTKICKLCGHKFDPNNRTLLESAKEWNWEGNDSG